MTEYEGWTRFKFLLAVMTGRYERVLRHGYRGFAQATQMNAFVFAAAEMCGIPVD